jgi:hypothetical protein
MRIRFNLADLVRTELDQRLASSEEPIVARIEAAEIASSVRSRLGQQALSSLREFTQNGGDFKKAADALSLSSRVVQKDISSAMSMIAEYAESIDEARAAYANLVESLF